MNSYTIQTTSNKQKYNDLLEQAWVEYQSFFNFTPKIKPCLFFLKSRQEYNDICGRETESWVTGYNINNLIFMFEESVYEKESSKKFNSESYPLTIKHELCHFFYHQITRGNRPVWFNEGLSIYLSGQLKFRSRPDSFKNFLLFTDKNSVDDKTVYGEAGFVIEKLFNKFGKEKLIKFIKSCFEIRNNDDFLKSFSQTYGFDLNYDKINQL